MQTTPMPTPDRYPPGLPVSLRAWHDALPIDDEPVTEEERAAVEAAKAEPGPGCSSDELARRLEAATPGVVFVDAYCDKCGAVVPPDGGEFWMAEDGVHARHSNVSVCRKNLEHLQPARRLNDDRKDP